MTFTCSPLQQFYSKCLVVSFSKFSASSGSQLVPNSNRSCRSCFISVIRTIHSITSVCFTSDSINSRPVTESVRYPSISFFSKYTPLYDMASVGRLVPTCHYLLYFTNGYHYLLPRNLSLNFECLLISFLICSVYLHVRIHDH